MNARWMDLEIGQFSFLLPLFKLGVDRVKAWLPDTDGEKIRRTSSDGTWLLRTEGATQDVAILWSDFRVNGGSFGRDISRRIASFLQDCGTRDLPLIMVFNSLGYRFIEGRAVFNDVFNLVPEIDRYSRGQLVVSICHGQCLGLAAILFGLGHYRIGVRHDSTLNLTGPDVFRMFFGHKVDFNSFASVDQQHLKTSLIHARVENLTEAMTNAYALIRVPNDTRHLLPVHVAEHEDTILDFLPRQRQKVARACQKLLAPIADRHLALFVDFDNRMRVYLVDSGGMLFGLLMNPPENSNNMITVRTLKLYQDALRLFAILRVPVVSFLDTPGVDPRMDNSNQDVIQQMISTNRAIIEYPFPKMGVWIGRGFGGANTLVIPSVYGSLANYVILDRTTLGVMHESIIAHLLEKSKRMLQLWQKSRETESEDFNDIVEAGIATRAIQLEELPSVIRCFLLGQEPAQQMASFSVASLADDQESTVCV